MTNFLDTARVLTEKGIVDYHGDGLFTAEASTLAGYGKDIHTHINLESTKTGKVLRFNFKKTEYDDEGDVLYWDFANAANGFCIRVFND